MRIICLTGLPGVGKSTFCFILSLFTNFLYKDSDYYIKNFYNLDIEKFLFSKKKEFFFRNTEKNLFLKYINFFSLGGGFFLNYLNFLFLLKKISILYFSFLNKTNRNIIKNLGFNNILKQRIKILKFQYLINYYEN
ncbi:shikimate kinase [Candidatus Vidania fulgoroideorum]